MQQDQVDRLWQRSISATALVLSTVTESDAFQHSSLRQNYPSSDMWFTEEVGIRIPSLVGWEIGGGGRRSNGCMKKFYQDVDSRLISGWSRASDDVTWAECVASATSWSHIAQQCLDSVEITQIDQAPDVLRLQRSDFPTSQSWLQAEYQQQIRLDVLAEMAELRDTLSQSHPEDYRCWLTVTEPDKLSGSDLVRELLPRFRYVSAAGETFIQVPLTVVAMMCRITDTTLSEWHPASTDPTGKSILDATLALLSANNRPEHILSMWGLACAVTGADESVIYGSPDLEVAPSRSTLLTPPRSHHRVSVRAA